MSHRDASCGNLSMVADFVASSEGIAHEHPPANPVVPTLFERPIVTRLAVTCLWLPILWRTSLWMTSARKVALTTDRADISSVVAAPEKLDERLARAYELLHEQVNIRPMSQALFSRVQFRYLLSCYSLV